VLAGKTVINPTFDTLAAPILPYLGQTQGQMQTTEEAARNDSEAFDEKELKLEKGSKELLSKYLAQLSLCEGKAELESIGVEIKKSKPDMTAQDLKELRASYLEKEDEMKARKTA